MNRILKKALPWGILFLLVVCTLLINVYAVPGHDELSYAFAGQNTPIHGESPRVASLGDIIQQQWRDYTTPGINGRVFVHGIVALFSGFKFYYLFDVINTLVWFLFVYAILKEGQVKIQNIKSYLFGFLFVYWFLWESETCAGNAAFAVNYLWTACASVGIIVLWRNLQKWWQVPLFFLFGWSQECFVLPTLAATLGAGILRSIIQRRWTLSRLQMISWLFMLAGACCLCLCPAALGRAGGLLNAGMTAIIIAAIHTLAGITLLIGPIILIILISITLFKCRAKFWTTLDTSLEWWLYLCAGIGLCLLFGNQGIVRISMAATMAASILVLRHTSKTPFMRWRFLLSSLAILWMIGGTITSVRMGNEVYRMLEQYKHSKDGIVYRQVISPGIWNYTIPSLLYNRWHTALFRREYNHSERMTVLTRRLYEDLYQTPNKFFSYATCVNPANQLYTLPGCTNLIVQRGNTPLNVSLQSIFSQIKEIPPTGISRFIPGRFKMMFPDENYYLQLPSDRFEMKTQTGEIVTLYCPLEKKS